MLVFYNRLPDDGPSWTETSRRTSIKLNYNKGAFSCNSYTLVPALVPKVNV